MIARVPLAGEFEVWPPLICMALGRAMPWHQQQQQPQLPANGTSACRPSAPPMARATASAHAQMRSHSVMAGSARYESYATELKGQNITS